MDARKRVKGPQVRIGVIGVGGMGSNHCKSMNRVPEARLTAVCDISEATAKAIGETYQVPYFTSHLDLIQSKLCDAVMIATPHPVRPDIAIDAMKARLHVLSEKPLSERVMTADKMVKTAGQKGVALAVMFQRRLEPPFAKAIELVKAGALGKVWRTTMISPEYRTQAYYDSGNWRATWSGEGGGVMMNQGPHILDLFVQLGGMPSEVTGRCETRLHKIEVEDVAEALLRYPDGGTGYLYCSTNELGPGQMIEVFGTHGKLCYRDKVLKFYRFSQPVPEFTFSTKVAWSAPECKEEVLEIPEAEWGHYSILQNFCRHLLTGEKLVSPGEDGIQSLELANAVWLSASLGKPVKLPLNRRAYEKFLAKKRETSTFVKTDVTEQRVTDPSLTVTK
jgi:UDP-N-acetyl-2-amino-2-deoxyglucuronate dehydrogenase